MSRSLGVAFSCLLAAILLTGSVLPAAAEPLDYDIPNGHFFKQANGQGGAGASGYSVVDDTEARFWAEFKRFGGVPVVGYPVSQRFVWDGFLCQAFQKVVFQWRPEIGQVYFVNVFDRMNGAGMDPWLDTVRQTPPSFDNSPDAGLSWSAVVKRHLGLLDSNSAIKAKFLADNDPVLHYGLPMSYKDYGNVFVVRAQRAVFQQWKTEVPWAKAGEVVVANGGDVAKEAGMYPEWAIVPEPGNGQAAIGWTILVQGDLPPGYSGQLTPGRLSYPLDVAVDDRGNIYVADGVCGCLQKYAPDGQLITQLDQIIGMNDDRLMSGVGVDGAGNVYAAHPGARRVVKYDIDGRPVAGWEVDGAHDVAVDEQGTIYVAAGDRIVKMASDGKVQAEWKKVGDRTLRYANYVAVDRTGNIYVSEGHWPGSNATGGYVVAILKISPDGALLGMLGRPDAFGPQPGEFADPQGLAVDGWGNVYIADWGNQRIQKFSANGGFTDLWGSFGDGPGLFRTPQGVAVDLDGRLYVVDQGNHQLQKMVP